MRSVVEIGASVPAFLGKLWKLVNDTETNHLISWSPGGKTFVIKNQADFARELLPLYYKHNNMASFIRQLNMYGFHKITSVENGGLRYEKDEIEFSHPCFMKGHAYLLEHIKRKIANSKALVASNESGDKVLLKPELMNKMLTDVKQMKGKQESLDAKFSAMKQENEALWREVAILRQKHMKQQQIVNNLIQFLMSLVHTPTRTPPPQNTPTTVKRPYQLMINNAAHNSTADSYPGRTKTMKLDKESLLDELTEDNQEDGPTIHELAHDDVLQSDNIQESIPNANFNFEVPLITSIPTSQNPTDPTTSAYHVTLEDGDDTESAELGVMYPVSRHNGSPKTNDNMPIITTPSPTPASMLDQSIIEQVINKADGQVSKSRGSVNRNITPASKSLLNSYHALNPSADLKLPAEIFASDDSVSDVGITGTEDISMQNALQDLVQESLLTNSKDKMLGGLQSIKLEKPSGATKINKKSKKSQNTDVHLNLADIKTELQDDFDWNNMALATVNNKNNVNRFQTRSRRDNNGKNREDYSSLFGTNSNKNDIDDHLDAMQTDLESLRELLRSDSYAFDSNTLLGSADARVLPSMSLAIPSYQHTTNNLFGSDDPFYGLPYNTMEEKAKSANNVQGNQLISYTGNIPDFEDISIPDLECDNSQDGCDSPLPSSSSLNTPQVQIRSPSFTIKP